MSEIPSSAAERVELCKSDSLTAISRLTFPSLALVLKTCFIRDPPSQFVYQLNEGNQATLSGFGRRFQYSHAYEPAAEEGVYRAALCRSILTTVLEAAQTLAGEDGMDPQRVAELKEISTAYSQMNTLAPMPEPEEETSIIPVSAVLAAASLPTPPPSVATTQPTSPPPLDLITYPHLPSSLSVPSTSVPRTAESPAARSRPNSSTPAPLPPQSAQYKASMPTPYFEQKVKLEEAPSSTGRPRPISQEAADLQAWTDLLCEPIPETAYDRLSKFLSLHFGQCRNPDVYKPFIQFRYNEEGGASFTLIREVEVWPRSRLLSDGSYLEHAEQMSVSKLKDGFLKKCLKKKMPKAAFSAMIQKVIVKYSNLSSLCTASKALADILAKSQKNNGQVPSFNGTLSASVKPKQPIKIAGSAVSKANTVSKAVDVSAATTSAKRTTAAIPEGPKSANGASSTDRTVPDMPKAMRSTEPISASVLSNSKTIQTLPTSLPDRPKALRAPALPGAPEASGACQGKEGTHNGPSGSSCAGALPSGSSSSFALPSKPAFEPTVPLSPRAADYSMRLRDHYAPHEKHLDRASTSTSMRPERSTSGEPSERRKRRERFPSSAAEGHRREKRRRSDSIADRDYRSERDDDRDRRQRDAASARRSRSPNMYRPEDRKRRRSRSRTRSPERRSKEKEGSYRRRSDDDEDRHSSRRRRSDDETRKSRRDSHDHSDYAKRRRGSDYSSTSAVDDKAILAILDLFAGTATGKLDLAKAIKQAAGLALSSDIRASTLDALQAIYEASPQYLMEKSDIPAGTECVMLPKTWVEETMKLLSN